MDKKIAVIGSTGFVGGALSRFLKSRGLEVVEYHTDKGTSSHTREEVNECDIAFVCVPTPMDSAGFCDTSIIKEVVGWLNTPLIVIKSTVPVGTTANLIADTGKHIVHNPEFLREQHADYDTANPDLIVVGGKYPHELINLLKRVYWNPSIAIVDHKTSEMIKYSVNAFLANKVVFFNEVKGICDKLGVEYEAVKSVLRSEPRIGRTHMDVTEEGGFGGHCFPKDLNALIRTAQLNGYDPEVLKSTWNHNRKFRSEFSGEEFNFYED